MCEYTRADSLAFLSIDGLYRAVGGEPRNPARPQFTDHYFTGDYPTRLLDKHGEAMGNKVSMLASRSEEHTSELQSLMRISYAVFCLKKKKQIETEQLKLITKTIQKTYDIRERNTIY